MESLVRQITQERLLVGIKEGAAALGIGITLMRELIAAGAVQSVHVGGRHLIPTSALLDYVQGLQGDSRHEEN
jgi:hypothetical protein